MSSITTVSAQASMAAYQAKYAKAEKTAETNETQETKATTETEKTAETPAKKDAYVKTSSSNTDAAKSTSYADKVASLLADSNRKLAEFKNMFASLLGGQVKNFDISKLSADVVDIACQNATTEDIQAAKAAITGDGAYSVSSVTDRIMDMAEALAGGDSTKIATLRDAVTKGFKEAGMTFGRDLPQICNDTYESVMDRFDEWEKKAGTASDD